MYRIVENFGGRKLWQIWQTVVEFTKVQKFTTTYVPVSQSQGCMFPTHISLGMRVSPHISLEMHVSHQLYMFPSVVSACLACMHAYSYTYECIQTYI